MKILVINGHPDKESYCQAIFQTIVETIDSSRHELKVISLNEEECPSLWISKADGGRFLYPSFSGINPMGRSFHLCLSYLVE